MDRPAIALVASENVKCACMLTAVSVSVLVMGSALYLVRTERKRNDVNRGFNRAETLDE